MSRQYRRVILTSGHVIDAPDMATSRFPPGLEPVVASHIEIVLEGWNVGDGDLVLNGGARGADILCAESAHRRGAAVEIILASEPDQFAQTSVSLPNSIWRERFEYLLRHHTYRISRAEDHEPTLNEYARVNDTLVRRAEELSPPAQLHIILIWDEQPAVGQGGTGDFAHLARRLHAPLAIINPRRC